MGEKPANPWGLYDVHGNVWEWTLSERDWQAYRKRGSGFEIDPATVSLAATAAVAPRGRGQVFRGGSYADTADGARSAYRDWNLPRVQFRNLGFRVALPNSEPLTP